MVKRSSVKCFPRLINSSVKIFRRLSLFTDELFTAKVWLGTRVMNKAIKRETFPIQTVDSLIDSMICAKIFYKIDLKNVYT